MRDIIITMIILGLLPMVIKRPWTGTVVWVWLAMMIPYRLAYGFARGLPFAMIVAICTLIGIVAMRPKMAWPKSSVKTVYLLFIGWMFVTSIFALNSSDKVIAQLVTVLKIHFMVMLAVALIHERKQLEVLVWTLVGSLAFYGVKGGLFTIASGGSGRVWGPSGGVIEGNNELGVALVVILPLLFYLYQITEKKWLRRGLLFSGLVTMLCVLGTQSRGALLAIVSMACMLGLKSRRPVLTLVAIVMVLGVAIVFMPDSWNKRMNTIQDFQADGSAMSRLYTWTTLWNCAVDRPLVGAGFGTDNPLVFRLYGPAIEVGGYDFAGGQVLVAHSIYFQALGEHGFPGLALFLLLGVVTWTRASAVSSAAAKAPDLAPWLPLLMRMAQASLLGFAVGGAFLTLVHFDLPYYLCAIVMIADHMMKKVQAQSSSPSAAATGSALPAH
ncbi:putative O-glycosylation ligase, exosortase A system-associated [Paucibacter sp. DJ1R-11]|uniref:putative O-glycosylation ligase, exosortase A system-associated n=1 Tax=Paucibacter sp. DJ1R-11 TaxID=2893556 RepID=UPI0021E465AA|nr:putative O-glycosylation ligase, exosortase A system-associated [Paucibacter sp. DJ1R-11]MCV2364579.1 putative O-glycosylation ligase, exosortase A system-associated [Paucibacter sp. DJ1R-11]